MVSDVTAPTDAQAEAQLVAAFRQARAEGLNAAGIAHDFAKVLEAHRHRRDAEAHRQRGDARKGAAAGDLALEAAISAFTTLARPELNRVFVAGVLSVASDDPAAARVNVITRSVELAADFDEKAAGDVARAAARED